MTKLIFAVCLLASMNLIAQKADTTYWKHSFNGSIIFNQAAFSENWISGGINTIGLNALINYKANYKKGKHSWDNEIDFLYGFINNADQGQRKNNDRIWLDTKYGFALSPKWGTFFAFNILTQFAEGYRYDQDSLGRDEEVLISEFMAPGYITFSWGFEYTPKPYFNLRLSPLAPRVTVVKNEDLYLNVENNYGVEIGQTTRWEWLAFQLLADFDKDLSENIHLKFRYLMYANYENLDFDEIDHRFEVILSAKVAKYIDVKLGSIIVYDFDQDKDIQFSQSLGIGFVYTFKNFTEEE